MFKRKHKIEVVPENQWTDFSSRMKEESGKPATKRDFAIAALAPAVVGAPLVAYRFANTPENYTSTIVPASAPVIEPINVLAQSPTITFAPPSISVAGSVTQEAMIPTGYVADASLEMLANVLDPLIQIMMVISFPIASVIMIGGSFFFLLGNSEKAWQTIFNSALGYIIIQMSPLFLEILRTIGKSV